MLLLLKSFLESFYVIVNYSRCFWNPDRSVVTHSPKEEIVSLKGQGNPSKEGNASLTSYPAEWWARKNRGSFCGNADERIQSCFTFHV